MPGERPPRSLFRRIAVRLSLLVLAFGVLNALLVVWIYSHDQGQLARDLIRHEAPRVAAAALAGRSPLPPDAAARWRWAVMDERGSTLVAGGTAPPPVAAPFAAVEWTSHARAGALRQIAGVSRVELDGRAYWVGLALEAPAAKVFTGPILLELAEHVALPLAPLILLLLGFSLWQVRRLTAPLRRAAAEAARLDPAKLDARLSEPADAGEVFSLVRAVNGALDRIEAGTRLVREFNANAAHELRTPLSVMKLTIDRMPDSPAVRTLREDVGALIRIVTQMLDLAQADAMSRAPAGDVDLKGVVADVIARTAPLAWEMKRDVRLEVAAGPLVKGHAEAIGRAVRNLLDNALRHTPEGTTVEVTVGPGPRVSVRDYGPGVPAGQRDAVFERFWRADRTHSNGAGLGLGIVQATMAAHGGSVDVADAPGGGATFVLTFPEGDASGPPGSGVKRSAGGAPPRSRAMRLPYGLSMTRHPGSRSPQTR